MRKSRIILLSALPIIVALFAFSYAYSSQTFVLTATSEPKLFDSATIDVVGDDQTPAGTGIVLSGWFTIEHYDKDRNLLSTQTIHNRFLDVGEDFVIDQSFKEGTAGETVDADQIATICITDEVGFVDTSETLTAATFDTGNLITENNCISDAAVIQATQTAQIGPETFTCGGTNCADGDIITGIGICQGAAATPFLDCREAQAASSGILFAVVNIADVTLNAAETVDITYTWDISSPSN